MRFHSGSIQPVSECFIQQMIQQCPKNIKKRPPNQSSWTHPGHSTLRWVHFETLWTWSMTVYDVYVELYRCPDRSGSPHQNGNKISTERPLPWRHGRHRKWVRKFGESTASLREGSHAGHQTLPAWHGTVVKMHQIRGVSQNAVSQPQIWTLLPPFC